MLVNRMMFSFHPSSLQIRVHVVDNNYCHTYRLARDGSGIPARGSFLRFAQAFGLRSRASEQVLRYYREYHLLIKICQTDKFKVGCVFCEENNQTYLSGYGIWCPNGSNLSVWKTGAFLLLSLIHI